jgi:hypothetical protein
VDDRIRADLLLAVREEHTTGVAVSYADVLAWYSAMGEEPERLDVDRPLPIHCRRCDRHIEIPCRSDAEQLADGTWRMTVHLDHVALQAHFDTHTDED